MNTIYKMKHCKLQIANWLLVFWAAAAPFRRGLRARLANVAMVADEGAVVAEGFANEVVPGEEWIQLSPYGEFPHPKGIQRVTKESAQAMENSFRSLLGKLKRRFRGVPVYRGHPDVPEVKDEYPDDQAYAWLENIEARDDGLYGKPNWSGPGAEMVKNRAYRFPSCYWDAKEAGVDKKSGKKIYEPTTLLSVGLTNQPRIPVQALANAETETKENEMNREVMAALLGLAATATEADITNKITELRGLPTRVSALENAETATKESLKTITAARDAATTKLANVAKERNRLALENAIAAGRLTPAEKADWEAKLDADYETNAALLAKKEKAMKTSSRLGNIGERRTGLANAQEIASGKFNAEVAKNKAAGMAHHDAYMAAKEAHQDLYNAMSASEEENS
jgi:hypothetical protein